MKTTPLAILIAAGALLGAAVPAHAENAMYSCTRADGTVSLTNVPVGTQCEHLFGYKPPVDAAPAPVAATPAAPVASGAGTQVARQPMAAAEAADRKAPSPANAKPAAIPHSPLAMRMAQRRDAARQAVADAYARGEPVANPATSRRYLMTNRADYMQANGFTPQ